MKQANKTILLLGTLVILLTFACIYAFLSKGKASPGVLLFMYKKNAIVYSSQAMDTVNFWDNYPYWTMTSTGHIVDIEDCLEDDGGIEDKYRVCYLRLVPSIIEDDSLGKILYSSLVKTHSKICILYDTLPNSFSNIKMVTNAVSFHRLKRNLNINMEDLGRSYLFTIDSVKNEVQDIYVPRIETPGVLIKYLEFTKQ